jgi:hypothetical protein
MGLPPPFMGSCWFRACYARYVAYKPMKGRLTARSYLR